MKKLVYIFLVVFMTSCGSSLTYDEAIQEYEGYESAEAKEDARYLANAKSYSILLKKLGELGTERAYAVVVQDYARKIVQDHTNLNEQLNELAKKEDIKLPSKMSEQHQQLFQTLQNTSRQDFDKAFFRQIERAYEDSIQLYKDIATDASDDEIRSFAASKLRVLRDNENRADEMEDEVL